jgi:hypothetical protein
MGTIIDEFVVAFGLDPKKHTAGTKEILKNQKGLREDAIKTSREQEAQYKRVGESFTSLSRQAVGFVTLLAGAKGIKDLAADMIFGAATAGRFAANMGMSTRVLYGWQYAVKSVGGQAEQATAALQTMTQAISNYKLTQHTGSDDAAYSALGFQPSDFTDPTAMLLKLSAAAQTMERTRFVNLAHRIGINDDMINLLTKGRVGVQALVAQGERFSNVTDDDVRAAQRFQESLNRISTLIKGQLQPYLTKLVDNLNGIATGADGGEAALKKIRIGLLAAAGAAIVAFPAISGAAIVFGALGLGIYGLWQRIEQYGPKIMKWLDDFGKKNPELAKAWQHLSDLFGKLDNWIGIKHPGQLLAELGTWDGKTPLTDMLPGGQQRTGAIDGGLNSAKRNNPGNIRDGSFARSQPGYSGSSNGFAIFNSMDAGYAAQRRLLQNYLRRGYDTPTLIANKWAPYGDGSNDPAAYAASLARQLHIGANDRITEADLDRFLVAQARIEHGRAIAAPTHAAARTTHSATAALRSRVAAAGGSTTVNLNGDIVIHTQARDAHQIASNIGPALKKRGIVQQANPGLQ